ncbi:MAG: WecB/TagA/CpsF family glycosyltransferase [Candidatus Eremiobacterota bacterium]
MVATQHPEIAALEILGVKVHRVSMDETVARVEAFLGEKDFHLVVTLGTEMIMRAQQDADYRDLVNRAELVVPDSFGVVWASRRTAYPLAERVPGVDLIPRLTRLPCGRRPRLFLLGGAPGVAEEAARALSDLYGADVAGTLHGYFREDEPVVQAINSSGAEILLAAMGFPRQEVWMARNRHRLNLRVGIGVGGSLDVLSGRVERAPTLFCRLGLEWLYRLLRQPSRFTRMLAIPRFMLQVWRSGPSGARPLP